MTSQPVLVTATLLSGMLPGIPAGAAEPPQVVASIKPVQSLAAGVMADIGAPDLLIRGYGSPHGYQMRPSEARALAAADVVLWIGEPLETFMAGPIRNLSANARVVSLLHADGMDLHPDRASGLWAGEHDHAEDRGATDPHIWLAPGNAKAMVDAIVAALGEVDPGRAERYVDNGAAVKTRIDGLDAHIRAVFFDVVDVPFIVFHDALHYFEHAFGLNAVGAATLDPDRQPGAGSVRALKRRLTDGDVRCFLVEPQFTPVLAETLAAGTPVASAVVDPIGADLPPGPDAYFEMMRANAGNLARCLGGG